jgi:hypothetical protein
MCTLESPFFTADSADLRRAICFLLASDENDWCELIIFSARFYMFTLQSCSRLGSRRRREVGTLDFVYYTVARITGISRRRALNSLKIYRYTGNDSPLFHSALVLSVGVICVYACALGNFERIPQLWSLLLL